MVSGEPPLTQHRQDQGAGGGLQETEQRTHTHHYRQDTCGVGKQLGSCVGATQEQAEGTSCSCVAQW